MAETKVNLTDEQLTHALTSYAQGKTTTQVVDSIFLDFNDLEDTSEIRAMLRDQLKSVNPRSKRFARVKYGLLYDNIREAIVEELRSQVGGAMQVVLSSLVQSIENLDTISESLLSMLGNASDFDITSNSEYINTVNAVSKVDKAKSEHVNIISNIANQLIELQTQGQAGLEFEDDS